MDCHRSKPHIHADGIAFDVEVDCVRRNCFITEPALLSLCDHPTEDDLLEIYRNHEAQINGMARRLVAAGVGGSPLIMRPESFASVRRPRAQG
jgi:hypothetical protein